MSKALTLFLPKVALEISMAPQIVLLDAVRESCIKFCKLSHIWKEWLDPISVITTERAIQIEHPDNARVMKVLRARFYTDASAQTILSPITPNSADVDHPGWDVDLSGEPASIFLDSDDEIRIAPHPATAGYISMQAVLRPSEASTSVADVLYLAHYQIIADGAKAHLMAQAGVDWTNPNRAAQLKEEFESAARSLNVAQATGFTRSRLRSRLENR